jgi:4-coumarate--CoA ligase
VDAVWQRLKIGVKQGYGLSECSPATHLQENHEWARYIGSIGKLVPNMECKVVGKDGNEVPLGEVSPRLFFAGLVNLSTFWGSSRVS